MIADKAGSGDLEKYIGCLDFLGTAGANFFFSAIGQMFLREKIRKRDGIEGSLVEDCFIAWCCLECSICQTANHVGLDD